MQGLIRISNYMALSLQKPSFRFRHWWRIYFSLYTFYKTFLHNSPFVARFEKLAKNLSNLTTRFRLFSCYSVLGGKTFLSSVMNSSSTHRGIRFGTNLLATNPGAVLSTVRRTKINLTRFSVKIEINLFWKFLSTTYYQIVTGLTIDFLW